MPHGKLRSTREQLAAVTANTTWGEAFAMRLNPPTIAIFLISLTLALLALITKLGFVGVPRYLPHQEFWLAITAYITLMVGNLVRGV